MFQKFLAKNLRKPEGIFGRFLLGKLNSLNDDMTTNAVAVLQPINDERLLDIGFGGGALFEKVWAVAPQARLYGADFSADVVAKGKRAFRKELEAGHLELQQAEASSLPYEDDLFDSVVTVNCVYFWPHPEVCLHEIARVTKPGGRVAVVYRSGTELQRFGAVQHGFRLYEPAELESIMRQAGFEDVRTEQRLERNGMTSQITLGKPGA